MSGPQHRDASRELLATCKASGVCGDAMYEGDIRPLVEEGNEGKFVVIDIETGAYEVDVDELVASDRLFARVPDAQVWLKRIGSRYVRRFGPRPQPDGK